METSKLLIISTIGPENAEKASLPFVLATASQALDVEVTMFFQSSAVVLAKQGEAGKVNAEGFQPLKEMLDTFLEAGGKLYLCSPCLAQRGITKEELIEGAEIGAAGTLVDLVMGASQVVTY
ncbi:sulfur reduction protein DsrE [Chlorobaculum sp. 24CR]|uniref:DsrE family protein n=1 Tax=Chlorobaculum sp. 24CR TaxID=2508878 RepID=UPI00100C1680|nr:DsrE family protein [Chlorobaculum sp. 24CR]RXK87832.1 sulfur reduction protein DsrE [Chlorobaculum sp. 24CR]